MLPPSAVVAFSTTSSIREAQGLRETSGTLFRASGLFKSAASSKDISSHRPISLRKSDFSFPFATANPIFLTFDFETSAEPDGTEGGVFRFRDKTEMQ